MVGHPGSEVPLCLECHSKFQDVVDRRIENSERMMNYLSDLMEARIGIPGLAPRFPPRPPRTVIQAGNFTMHNIRIDRSSIGVLNTGYINSVDTAIGTMRGSGEESAADAFRSLTEELVRIQGVEAEHKDKVLEILSVLASEATVPREQRRKSAMRALLSELATLTSGVAALAQLYSQYAPAIAALFQ
jgi:hypothetical protein